MISGDYRALAMMAHSIRSKAMDRENEDCVIMNAEGKFWTGSKFHDEYPEAELYCEAAGDRAIDHCPKLENYSPLYLVRDYGLKSQKTIIDAHTIACDCPSVGCAGEGKPERYDSMCDRAVSLMSE